MRIPLPTTGNLKDCSLATNCAWTTSAQGCGELSSSLWQSLTAHQNMFGKLHFGWCIMQVADNCLGEPVYASLSNIVDLFSLSPPPRFTRSLDSMLPSRRKVRFWVNAVEPLSPSRVSLLEVWTSDQAQNLWRCGLRGLPVLRCTSTWEIHAISTFKHFADGQESKPRCSSGNSHPKADERQNI